MIHFPGMPAPLARVVEMFSTLPGVGPKTAMRLGLNLLTRPASDTLALASALHSLHEQVSFCDCCGCFSEQGHCHFCDDPKRDRSTICVVEQPVDVLMMERGHGYRGSYHVLQGRLSPVDGMGPDQLRLVSLDRRVEQGIREMIMATSATVDGEATAHYLANRYQQGAVHVSRIARGVPEGSELEYLDEHTLSRALDQRVCWQ
ncbi:MAG: recombination mediator RecR [Mariprofundus sp.]|nr:recombination mediator RecR [Mariprofundus sp.]